MVTAETSGILDTGTCDHSVLVGRVHLHADADSDVTITCPRCGGKPFDRPNGVRVVTPGTGPQPDYVIDKYEFFNPATGEPVEIGPGSPAPDDYISQWTAHRVEKSR